MTEEIEDKKVPAWARELQAEQKRMQTELDKKDKTISMLQDIVGKSKTLDWEDAHRDLTTKVVYFRVNDGKTIIGWKKMDYSKFNPNASKPRDENAYTTVIYRDGSEEKINYSVFTNLTDRVSAKISHRGLEESLIEFTDGEKITIENKFLN